MIAKLCALAVVALSLGANHAQAHNLLGNGGFETPVTPAGGYVLYNGGASIGAWTVTGVQVATVSTTFSQDGFTFDAKSGQAYLDLTGNANAVSGVSQTVSTTQGARYTLNFSVGAVYEPNGPFSTFSTVLVYVNGNLISTATNQLTSAGTRQSWKHFSVSFTATGSSTTVSFVNGNPYNGSHANCALDAVSLTEARGGASAGALLGGLRR